MGDMQEGDMDTDKYKESLRKQANQMKGKTDRLETSELLEDLVRGGAEDLYFKREANLLNAKDFGILLKLIEGHSKLETVKLKKDESRKGTTEEAERLLLQLGVPPELVAQLMEKPLEIEHAETSESD